jgi:hypothetical protein
VSAIQILPEDKLGFGFIPPEYLAPGRDENYIRNEQSGKTDADFRHLSSKEIEILVKNQNTCDDWDNILVTDIFEPHKIENCEFYGIVRIGKLENVILRHHDLHLPAGITDSRIISCDIGDNAAVHSVQYLSHYIVGDTCILFNIDEMDTTDHAKFGNGIVKEGESEDLLNWIDLMNEAGGRSVLPFDGMIPADAYLWAKFRDDPELMAKLKDLTQKSCDPRRGYYGTVGNNSVIKSCRIIKDVKIGPHSYIKGANKLKNLTINSDENGPAQIGEGVELVNGIIGYGCHIFYGCKAVRFVMCDHSNLKYGARLIHSVLGENSTVSCCEILNNLVFPAHEQHHNTSFLAASVIMGQSNIASGATIGSNHNSRSNDGEIQAGRGFWPGLCVSLKHSSKFASYTLIQKGAYPSELNIPLPFSLVMNNEHKGRLEIIPAFWWMYNMYGLARNAWKFADRDKRTRKIQNIEFDPLAPDTAEEIFQALGLLEVWTAKAALRGSGDGLRLEKMSEADLRGFGKKILTGEMDGPDSLEVFGENIECSRRPAAIMKYRKAYHAYREMLVYYGVKNLLEFLESNPAATLRSLNEDLAGPRETSWTNLGGQLIPQGHFAGLLSEIKSGKHSSWREIHRAYDLLWEAYPREKYRHARASLLSVLESEDLSSELWDTALKMGADVQTYICDAVYDSRNKDYQNSFRELTFRNGEEKSAVVGTIEENGFIKRLRKETENFLARIEKIRTRTL